MSAEDQIEDSSAPLIEHLAELRTRLIRSVLAFVVAMVACFTVAQPILGIIQQPLINVLVARGQSPELIFTAPQEQFFVLVRISIIAGFAVSFPVIAHQLWRFVAPGLYASEKGAILPFLFASPVLFFMGASFAHYVVTPLAMNFLHRLCGRDPDADEHGSGQRAAARLRKHVRAAHRLSRLDP